MNVPIAEGVPLIVITPEDQIAVTPGGSPVAAPMPFAPVVEWVTLAIAILTHSVGDEEAVPTVLAGVTVIVPVAFTLLHPPVSGIV